jgi:glycosyltransferase involved in cell wall biosynthesis
MARLAFFSPWPPQPSGIAACAADVVPQLADAGHGVDVLVDEALLPVERGPDGPPAPGAVRVIGAHEFVWRQARGHYDLPIYQVGNSWAHGFIWPYLFRWPGLSVLHDARLHHARANALMARKRHADYRAEFRFNHPDVSPDAAELAIAGFDGAYYYHWPMRRAVIEASRVVACHSHALCRDMQAEHPDRTIVHVTLGHGIAPSAEALAVGRRRFRDAHGLAPDAVVLSVLGNIAEERHIAQVARAFMGIREWTPSARLVFAGSVDPLLALDALLDRFGIRDATTVTGRVDDAVFDDAIAASDIGINLRWPTAREISGPWLRMLAAGLPTVIVDALHTTDAPTLDPRTWRCHTPTVSLAPNPERDAVAVSVDILDEDHSLRLAVRRLVAEPEFRHSLGAAGRRYWLSHHTIPLMVADYGHAITRALGVAPPTIHLPSHLRPDPSSFAATLVQDMVERPLFD